MSFFLGRDEEDIQADELQILLNTISEFRTPPQELWAIFYQAMVRRVADGKAAAERGPFIPYPLIKAMDDVDTLEKSAKVMRAYQAERETARSHEEIGYDRFDEQC